MTELFHSTTDTDSADARRAVIDLKLVEKIHFRNVFYPEVQAQFEKLGGSKLPALWDGTRLVEGKAAVLAALATLSG